METCHALLHKVMNDKLTAEEEADAKTLCSGSLCKIRGRSTDDGVCEGSFETDPGGHDSAFSEVTRSNAWLHIKVR
jgi:hypothetical protein